METRPYENLQPETILTSVEQAGFITNGRLLALNSYENRVYQVGVEDARPVVVKFYRPGRWSDEAILEEHAFALELAKSEIPVVPPIEVGGETLLRTDGYRFAVYRSCGGRWPELGTAEERRILGRFLGRLHMVGCAVPFRHRPGIDVDRLGQSSRDWLLENGWIPPHLEAAYDSLTESLVDAVQERIGLAGNPETMRIHGDCHLGNILWTDDGPHFVDLDDCVTGPAVQDLWMLLSGSEDEMRGQLTDLLDGYREFADFDTRELWLIEALRTLRIMHYQAWIARRWEDPAFPRAFPWFEETRNWEDHILALREQAAHLQEGPLQL
jgi:Ser/Thr protein kinase RdoA (MazF antagonist)